jgi:hypothetical protein
MGTGGEAMKKARVRVMAKVPKRAAKQSAAASDTSPSEAPSSELLAAFTEAPPSFLPLVASLSPKHVYLIHLDQHSEGHKRQIFIIYILLNLAITAAILHRGYIGYFTYSNILLAILRHSGPASFDPSAESWRSIFSTLGHRTLTFLVDYLLLTLFLPWPIRFWLGPTRWRRRIGFQATEIIIRRSRSWSEILEPGTWVCDDEATLKERILPAITPLRLQKTGHLLVDADWDLDFPAMIRAHELVGKNKLQFEGFQISVLAYGANDKGWLVWFAGDVRESPEGPEPSQSSSSSSSLRNEIIEFKDKLTSMGKEDLFFRWVELIQYESTRPGGFTLDRQQSTMRQVKQLFEYHEVDFEKFWADVGGIKGISL